MEFPQRLILIERGLAVFAALCLLLMGIMEGASPLAAALREGKPWVDNVGENFIIYQPSGPSAAVISVGKKDARTVSDILAQLDPEETESVFQSYGDRLLWRLELSRLRPGEKETVLLPAEKSATRELLSKLLYPPVILPTHAVTAEILNASGVSGLALEAAKILRSNGVDVVGLGNWSGVLSHTVIYDRTGSPETARRARRALGCPQAETETEVDEKKMLDVTVVLAQDCFAGAHRSFFGDFKKEWRQFFFGRIRNA